MRHFFILLKDNLIQALKSKKSILFLVLYLAIFGLIVHGIKEAQKEILLQLGEQGGIDPALSRVGFNFAVEFLDIRNNDIIQQFLSIPFYSIQLFGVLLLGTPFLIQLIHYDKIAQEVSDGTFRYQLFRTSRGNIYWAKVASALIEIAIITFIATVLAVLYGELTLTYFEFWDVMKASLTYWLMGLVPLLTFSSLVLFFSAWVKRPFIALLLPGIAVLAAFIMMAWYPHFSPFHIDYWKGFFLPNTHLMWKSIGIYLGITAVISSAGYLIFKRKDL